jgi:hypothetical protein
VAKREDPGETVRVAVLLALVVAVNVAVRELVVTGIGTWPLKFGTFPFGSELKVTYVCVQVLAGPIPITEFGGNTPAGKMNETKPWGFVSRVAYDVHATALLREGGMMVAVWVAVETTELIRKRDTLVLAIGVSGGLLYAPFPSTSSAWKGCRQALFREHFARLYDQPTENSDREVVVHRSDRRGDSPCPVDRCLFGRRDPSRGRLGPRLQPGAAIEIARIGFAR